MRSIVPIMAALISIATLTACAAPRKPAALDFEVVRPRGQIAGDWLGGTDVTGGGTSIEASFRVSGSGFVGELRAPTEEVGTLPITGGVVSSDSIHFEFDSPLGHHEAAAAYRKGILFGRIHGSGLEGTFHLLPVAAPDEAALDAEAGTYSARPGHLMLVMRRPPGHLAWIETEPAPDGALRIGGGALYAYDRDTLVSDRSVIGDPTQHEYAAFETRSGPSPGVRWYPENRDPFVATRVDSQVGQRMGTFPGRGVTLGGTLLLPPGAGPFPAVAMVHGSGPGTRAVPLGLARAALFLRAGYAVLVYDKRGTGVSTGSWQDASLDDLAGDALGAVDWLRQQPEIAHQRVGLAGQSQAGWVISRALAQSNDVAFAAIFSGGAVSPRDQELYRAQTAARRAKLTPTQASEVEHLTNLKWGFAAGTVAWDEYVRAARSSLGTPVAAIASPVLQADAPEWKGMRSEATYDPAPDLRKIHVPVLVLFGDEDELFPASLAAKQWRDLVPATSPPMIEIKILPGVGHPLVETKAGAAFPAELVSTLNAWLSTQQRPSE